MHRQPAGRDSHRFRKRPSDIQALPFDLVSPDALRTERYNCPKDSRSTSWSFAHIPPRRIRPVGFAILWSTPWIAERFSVQPAIGVIARDAQPLPNVMALALMRRRLVSLLGGRGSRAENRSSSITVAHDESAARLRVEIVHCHGVWASKRILRIRN